MQFVIGGMNFWKKFLNIKMLKFKYICKRSYDIFDQKKDNNVKVILKPQ